MELIIKNTADAAAEHVHDLILDQLRHCPDFVFGLPTGGTPVPVYGRLVESYREGRGSWAQATVFNLDEYVGLDEAHPASYAAYMRRHLFDHVDCPIGQRHIPNGLAQDVEAEAVRYDASIAIAGGIDFLFLGLGTNAHIGFNEPGSDFQSRTRRVDLAPSTLADNARYFDNDTQPPRQAISMGIGTILEARKIVVMATGHTKADAVRQTVKGIPNVLAPGSALQSAPNVSVVLDSAAAAGL